MKVLINNASVELNNSNPVLAVAIAHAGVKDLKGLAVAVNNAVVPRTIWESFLLNENDTVTIIRATQGG